MPGYLNTSSLKTFVCTATLLLAACGGGGGDTSPPPASTDVSASGGAGSTTGSTTASTAITARLSGVAALGAPMAGARLQVVDATGTPVGSATTNAADGSFALTLLPATGPLMLQAAGTDAAGQPLVLHGAVPVLSSAVVANITPLSDAILAVALGAEPRTVFAKAKENPTALQGLASLTAASDFIKSLVKTNLSDAKTGDAKKLDLLADSSFTAAKVGVDLALETLVIGYGIGNKGAVQLQMSNKLSGVPAEVTVDLGTARTELAKTTGSAPATAITSTLKSTTSPTTLMATLVLLDDLVADINKAIAEGGAADGTAVTGLLVKYTQHDGGTKDAVALRIADWASKRMQLGRLQVTGCADETIAKTGCSRVLVAARVNDAAGMQADSFSDAVSYFAKDPKDPNDKSKWQLVGNGQVARTAANAVAWRALGADGSPTADSTGTPLLGVQLQIGDKATAATVQTPGGYALVQVPCARPTLCIALNGGDASVSATGALADDTVFSGVSQWLGTADLALSARYKVNLLTADGSTATRNTVLRSAFGTTPEVGRFPVLDGVSSSQPLPGTALLSSTTLAWSAWAAANPDLRVVFVRSVITDADGMATVSDVMPRTWLATSLELPQPEVPAGVVGLTLWLAAMDAAGRWYYTSYTLM
jgi:hypothetical protein